MQSAVRRGFFVVVFKNANSRKDASLAPEINFISCSHFLKSQTSIAVGLVTAVSSIFPDQNWPLAASVAVKRVGGAGTGTKRH